MSRSAGLLDCKSKALREIVREDKAMQDACSKQVEVEGDVPWKLAFYIRRWWRGKGQPKCINSSDKKITSESDFLVNG